MEPVCKLLSYAAQTQRHRKAVSEGGFIESYFMKKRTVSYLFLEGFNEEN